MSARASGRVALAVALTLTVAESPAGDLIRINPEQQAAFGVQLANPVAAGESLTRRYPAEVAVPNLQLRVVSAPQSGMLESLLVAEGERVQEGQILARLRSPDLLEAQSAWLEAVTRLQLAASELQRNRELFRDGIVAERRLLESRSRHQELATLADQWRQRLELTGMSGEDIAELKTSRRLTSSLPVRAPLSGVVLEQMVNTGQAVESAAPLYRVARLDPLWLEIHVPVNQLGSLAQGDRVVLPRQGVEGRVITVGRMVHGTDQGVLVRAEVHEGAGRLRPGQFVEVQLAEANPVSGWRVADAALVRKAGESFVLVARPQGFEAVPVQVLAREERDLVISGPVTPSDRIAVGGVVALKAAWLGGGGE
jgi:cobalt-zinc-cadmium efflux system membrane fusion protein